jgi:DNA invertase Pin-like site-specific DNA recombinase
LDRLGRNTRDVLNLVHELEEKGTSPPVLEPAIDTGGPMGRMVLTVLGMVAEMELGFTRDRQRAGIDAAKAKGVYRGRPATFDRAPIVALRKGGIALPRCLCMLATSPAPPAEQQDQRRDQGEGNHAGVQFEPSARLVDPTDPA